MFLGPTLRKLVIFAIIILLSKMVWIPVLLLSHLVGVVLLSVLRDESLLEDVLRPFHLGHVS